MGSCQFQECKSKVDSKEMVLNSPLNIIEQIQKDFIVTSENENVIDQLYGVITILEPKSVQESLQGFKLAQKIIKFHEKREYKQALQMYENRFYGLNHPNLLIIHAMQNKKVDEFFNTDYVVSVYLDYPSRSFKRELLLRQRCWFTEQEVLYILDSVVGALAFLQSKGMAHQHLSFDHMYIVTLPNGNPSLKIDDSLMHQDPAFAREQPEELPIYFSPEQVAIFREDSSSSYDEFKSDVFTFGMLLLELCTLSKCNVFYDTQKWTIDEQGLHDLLIKIAERYSERLYELVKVMVHFSVKIRPDFLELDELISSTFVELINKRISTTWQYSDYQYCILESRLTNQSVRRESMQLVHPDQHSRGSQSVSKAKNPIAQRGSQRQLSSIKQNNEAPQSNLSIFEQGSPIISRKEQYDQNSSVFYKKEDSVLLSVGHKGM